MSNRYNVKIIIAENSRVALFYSITMCESTPKVKKFFEITDGFVKEILLHLLNNT